MVHTTVMGKAMDPLMPRPKASDASDAVPRLVSLELLVTPGSGRRALSSMIIMIKNKSLSSMLHLTETQCLRKLR